MKMVSSSVTTAYVLNSVPFVMEISIVLMDLMRSIVCIWLISSSARLQEHVFFSGKYVTMSKTVKMDQMRVNAVSCYTHRRIRSVRYYFRS